MLMSLLGQSTGMVIGAIRVKRPSEAMFIAPTATIPLILLSGFFVKVGNMPAFARPIAMLSYFRWAFKAIVTATYGLNRCQTYVTNNSTESLEDKMDQCKWVKDVSLMLEKEDYTLESMRPYLSMAFSDKPHVLEKLGGIEQQYKDFLVHTKNNSVLAAASGDTSGVERFYQGSNVMNNLELVDKDLWHSIYILIGFMVAYRVLAYLALCYKTRTG